MVITPNTPTMCNKKRIVKVLTFALTSYLTIVELYTTENVCTNHVLWLRESDFQGQNAKMKSRTRKKRELK